MRTIIGLAVLSTLTFGSLTGLAQVDPADEDRLEDDQLDDDLDEAPPDPADQVEPEDPVDPADPVEEAPPVQPDPVDEDPPAPPGGDMVNLGVDTELDARLERCYELISKGRNVDARLCLDEVAEHQRTTAGLRALGARRVFHLRMDDMSATSGVDQAKLWMGVAGGAFGLQHGITLSFLLNANVPLGALGILIGGGLTIAGALGYGFLGAAAVDQYGLTVEDAHLVVAGGFWGGAIGAQLAVLIGLLGFNNFNVPVLLQLAGSLAFAGGAVLAGGGRLSHGEISMMSTGGLLGGFVAAMALLTVSPFAPGVVLIPAVFSTTILAGNLAGLVAGLYLADWLGFEWGEVLLVDLGAILGLVSVGTVLLAAGVAGFVPPVEVAIPIITVGLSAGALGGATLAGYLINDGKTARGKSKGETRAHLVPTLIFDRDRQASLGVAAGLTF